MAKPCAAFLVFLCLSMLILSIPDISCQMNDCDCDHDHRCGEWEDESHGNCKQHHLRVVCTCTLDCPDISSTSNA
ncbi:putative defensin-like protein 12 [Arabidopsis thaliana]|uniref:Uncharacterized protein n=1 Tax=Arabidopsis thaliana x Arabidopsis arenosa TaxID=1240361 RepID=A0A8T2FR54_9BRAS|nr:hypothetical protein ISN45_At02g013490 [Arabidopsis thaliana x Arabidopsis arenosa]